MALPRLAAAVDGALLDSRLPAQAPAWLRRLRDHGADRFAERGFPSVREEDWKYTDVSPIARSAFRPAAPAAGQSVVESLGRLGLRGPRLVFVNGRFEAGLSAVAEVPRGVVIGSLWEGGPSVGQTAEAGLGQHARIDHPFVALNTAQLADAAVVRVGPGAVLDPPLHLVFVAGAVAEAVSAHPRVLVVLDEGAQASVLETYISAGGEAFFTNPVTELDVGAGALLFHGRVLAEASSGFQVGVVRANLAAGAKLRSLHLGLGARLSRTDLEVAFGGEGGECELYGAYVAGGQQHVDNHTLIEHGVPRCTSREVYRGVLGGQATGVFNGKIIVRPQAQQTDAEQTNRNLLLSKQATIDTKPQLEIFADDVRCTHGAAVGPPEEETLFYLRSRGLGPDLALGLLAYGFAADVLERGAPQALRPWLERIVRGRVEAVVRDREED